MSDAVSRKALIDWLNIEIDLSKGNDPELKADRWAFQHVKREIEHGKFDLYSARSRSLDEWHEDFGDVLWWQFPIVEPPYVGSPLDSEWPGYHTHWTKIEVPDIQEGESHE